MYYKKGITYFQKQKRHYIFCNGDTKDTLFFSLGLEEFKHNLRQKNFGTPMLSCFKCHHAEMEWRVTRKHCPCFD